MPELMKSQIFYEPEKMQLEEKAIPTPKSDDVLIKVKSVGICGSEFNGWDVGPDNGGQSSASV